MTRASTTRPAMPRGKWPRWSELVIDLSGIVPVAKGSKSAFAMKGKTGKYRAVMVDQKNDRLKTFEAAMRDAALGAMALRGLPCAVEQPFEVAIAFYLPRPKSHYFTGKRCAELRDNAPLEPWSKPDKDKLMRAVGDSLFGVVYDDDSRIVKTNEQKKYAGAGHDVGCWLSVRVRPATRRESIEWGPQPRNT